MKKERSMKAEIRDLRSDQIEMRQIRDRLKEERDQTDKTNQRLNVIRMAMYESLNAERLDLQGRLIRVESRIRLLDVEKPNAQR